VLENLSISHPVKQTLGLCDAILVAAALHNNDKRLLPFNPRGAIGDRGRLLRFVWW
jgi:hypothetical protein